MRQYHSYLALTPFTHSLTHLLTHYHDVTLWNLDLRTTALFDLFIFYVLDWHGHVTKKHHSLHNCILQFTHILHYFCLHFTYYTLPYTWSCISHVFLTFHTSHIISHLMCYTLQLTVLSSHRTATTHFPALLLNVSTHPATPCSPFCVLSQLLALLYLFVYWFIFILTFNYFPTIFWFLAFILKYLNFFGFIPPFTLYFDYLLNSDCYCLYACWELF